MGPLLVQVVVCRYNFLPACNVHDYGYQIMREKLMPWTQATAVDRHFGRNLKSKVCKAEKTWKGVLTSRWEQCIAYANQYELGVKTWHILNGYS